MRTCQRRGLPGAVELVRHYTLAKAHKPPIVTKVLFLAVFAQIYINRSTALQSYTIVAIMPVADPGF